MPTMRNCRDEDDWARIRAFLRQVMIANGLFEWSWHVARLDYWRWHGVANKLEGEVDRYAVTFLWETAGGEIAAVLNPEGRGDAFLQVHPRYCTGALLNEMLEAAERHLAKETDDGRRALQAWADAHDSTAHEVLARRGYERVERPGCREYMFRRALDELIEGPPEIPGYTVRSLGDGLELLERCWASGLGFHAGEIA